MKSLYLLILSSKCRSIFIYLHFFLKPVFLFARGSTDNRDREIKMEHKSPKNIYIYIYICIKLLLGLYGQQRCTKPGGSIKIHSPNLTANTVRDLFQLFTDR